MYIFRAINQFDAKALCNGSDIKAKRENHSDFMKSAAKHVANASRKDYEDCWISTTKNFRTCAEEFAIPQAGNFNTSSMEREIIVIDAMAWRENPKQYISNGNYTAFIDIAEKVLVDLGNANEYPVPVSKKVGKATRYYVNDEQLDRKLISTQVKYFLTKIQGADTGLLDVSFPTKTQRGRLPSISEFALLDYLNIKKNITDEYANELAGDVVEQCRRKPIVSGNAKSGEEVMVLNYIPNKYVKCRLSKLETSVLYTLNEVDFNNVLQKIINGTFVIKYIEKEGIYVNDTCIKLNDQECLIMTSFLVDLACEYCRKSDADIEKVYEDLKEKKRQILKRVLKEIDIIYSEINLQDDKVYVKQVAFDSKNPVISKDKKYDVLALEDEKSKKIKCYRDNDYQLFIKPYCMK